MEINPEFESLNSKQAQNSNIQNCKKYDLEDRTYTFTKNVIEFINKVSMTIPNSEITKQLIRSSGSVGANYIEANESLSKKDFLMRIKISRKEAKETRYWLRLISCEEDMNDERDKLIRESTELMKIFGSHS
ncbi:MAG: four helix bundle protein [Dehalococcoidia bacterium]|nr:MAG: four helix bundle protein [Dehalococcoidia bacterium]